MASNQFHLLVLHFEHLVALEEQRVEQLKNYESRSYNVGPLLMTCKKV